ncbi:MAG: response regulator receiver sensor signal transduction histidine kinase [Bacteroidota bacterium]|nr:response regulator receiver sensor signal transduction histidine kinase [Bacteroidota bacterium]
MISQTNHPVKILLVDDKKENLLSLQVILSNHEYQFIEASSGKEALRILLKSQDFAIILMDVQMPIMDGFETAELIRQSDKLKNVPIIFLTANMNSPEYIFRGYEAGAVDYMIKPLSPEILKAKVSIFAELYKKTHELLVQEEHMKTLNSFILAANKELELQNEEKERQATELRIANKELESFAYVSSHDLQEPLRKIQTFATIVLDKEKQNLSENGKYNLQRMQQAADRMQQLIQGLLAFSRTNIDKRKFEYTDLHEVIEDAKIELKEIIDEKNAVIESNDLGSAHIIPFQFRQLIINLFSNSLKFANPEVPSHIIVKSKNIKGSTIKNEKLSPEKDYCQITFKDNGIGFESHFSERIFEVFQKLHSKDEYPGTGIGLAIVKKIVDNHNGIIVATGELKKGATFDIFIPS